MKRLLLFAPLLLVLGGCATTAKTKAHSQGSKPIYSHTTTLDDVPLRLDVAGLSRIGSTVGLDLRLTNRAPRGGDAFSIDDTFSREGNYDLGGVSLVDPQTGRELEPLHDDGLDLGVIDISGGGSQTLSVAFPAPGGKTADVLVPHFGLFRDVPVR